MVVKIKKKTCYEAVEVTVLRIARGAELGQLRTEDFKCVLKPSHINTISKIVLYFPIE
jgi:hypothetical protein